MRLLGVSALMGSFLLVASVSVAQQVDPPKKIDPEKLQKKSGGLFDIEQLKKLTEQLAGKDGPLNPDQMKKMLEKFGVADGKFDPEQLNKMVEELTGKGGMFDIEQMQKMMEKVGIKDGKFDPDQLKKMLDDLGGKGGQLDPEELKKLFEKFGVTDGKFDAELFKKAIGEMIGGKTAEKGTADAGKKVAPDPVKKDKSDDKKGQEVDQQSVHLVTVFHKANAQGNSSEVKAQKVWYNRKTGEMKVGTIEWR